MTEHGSDRHGKVEKAGDRLLVRRPLRWDEWPEASRELFKAFRTPGAGEKLIPEKNVFVEKVLPGSILRKLSEKEMDADREPFREPAARRPVWRWPNHIPIDGESPEVVEIVGAHGRRLGESASPDRRRRTIVEAGA